MGARFMNAESASGGQKPAPGPKAGGEVGSNCEGDWWRCPGNQDLAHKKTVETRKPQRKKKKDGNRTSSAMKKGKRGLDEHP